MIEGNYAIPSRAITVRQWLDLGRLVTHNARVHQMRNEAEKRRYMAECRRPKPVITPFDSAGIIAQIQGNQ